MITTLQALQSLLPGVQVIMVDGEISEWMDEREQPTDEAIATELARLQAEYDANQYQRDRVYPQLGEQFDMLFHAIDEDETLKTQFADFHAALKEVKDDNPKPSE
jgi:predicted nuclease with TOPRIM domain